ncbi:MAG TPA: hypothetical protein VGS07_13530 [Thermoanaerobaculia bacterium]|jgi:hypothetical protein|nr:hypothetical protein [Thermoanaerobaculia bacterium]
MPKRVLVVADQHVMPTAKRYAYYFIDSALDESPLAMQDDLILARAESYQCFRLDRPDAKSLQSFDLARYTSVYFWGLYDRILVQDVFSKEEPDGKVVIDSLPLSVAHHLLYSRGQFATTRRRSVQPMLLDPGLLVRTALSSDGLVSLKWLSGPMQDDRVRLRRSLDTADFWGELFSLEVKSPESARLQLRLPPRTFKEVSDVVRETVKNGDLRILMIDDDPNWLKDPYKVFGGVDFDERVAGSNDDSCFWALRALGGKDPATIERFENFDELQQAISEFSAARGTCLSMVVTDVLFGRDSEKNGLDVLRYLRSVDLSASPRNVVIAFTGYGSPLLTAACHAEGADFVVQKSNTNGHGEARAHQVSEPSESPFTEMFWNVLWLRAATWFTCERLAQLEYEFRGNRSSTMEAEEAKRLVDQVWSDIDAVFPPQKWLTCFSRWRQEVVEVLTESANYVHFWADARGQKNRELTKWRRQIIENLRSLRNRFLNKKDK